MNILTDEELESIKFDQRDQLVDFETLRAVEAAVLAKLAALDMKPAAYITYKGHLLHADDPKVMEHSEPEALYTETQLLASQQRTAEACAKVCDEIAVTAWGCDSRFGEAVRNYWREYK